MYRHFVPFALVLLFGCAKEESVQTDTAAVDPPSITATDTVVTDVASNTIEPRKDDGGSYRHRPRPQVSRMSDDDLRELLSGLTQRQQLRDRGEDVGFLSTVDRITVLDDDGSKVGISSGGKTIIAQMATWCPFSRQYLDFLNDPEVKTQLSGYTFVFLFEQDEWPTVERHVREGAAEEHLSEQQIRARLKELKADAGYAPVFSPQFLEELPGKHYFVPAKSTIFGRGFPSIYDPRVHQCVQHPVKVFPNIISRSAFHDLWKRHEPA